jgi:hypothetical protein
MFLNGRQKLQCGPLISSTVWITDREMQRDFLKPARGNHRRRAIDDVILGVEIPLGKILGGR